MTAAPSTALQQNCFVIAPIGGTNSNERRAIDGLIRSVIAPVALELKLKVRAAHQMAASGSITNQVIEALLKDALVIADISGLNANVMYELAIRHAARLPVVTIASEGTRLPFDVGTERTIHYTPDFQGREDLLPLLKAAAEDAIQETDPDNPVYRAVQATVMKTVAAGSLETFMVERLDQLTAEVQKLARSVEAPANAFTGRQETTLAYLQSMAGERTLRFSERTTPEAIKTLVDWLSANNAGPVAMMQDRDGTGALSWVSGPTADKARDKGIRRFGIDFIEPQ